MAAVSLEDGVAGMTAVEMLGSVDELADRTGSSVDAAMRAEFGPYRNPVGRTRIMKPLTRLTVLGTGLLLVAVGMAHQGFDLQLTRYDESAPPVVKK